MKAHKIIKIIIIIIQLLFFSSVLFIQKLEAKIYIAFRNDDISYLSDPKFEYEVLKIFRKYNIRPLYAVIPAHNGNILRYGMPIVDALRLWYSRGWVDIAMHGYSHKNKFSDLSYDEQLKRIKAGKEIIVKLFSVDTLIFVPPWNSVNKNTIKILEKTGFKVFSGYLGEKPINGIKFINCNINLFEGPLGSIESLFLEISDVKNDVFLVVLFHTSYDFNKNSLQMLNDLLRHLSTYDNVIFCSFSDLIKNEKYIDYLEKVNRAGYHLKILQKNKYIRKIALRLPVISEYLIQQTKLAEEHYWKGNYEDVNKTYIEILIRVWVILFLFIIILISIITMLYKKLRSKRK